MNNQVGWFWKSEFGAIEFAERMSKQKREELKAFPAYSAPVMPSVEREPLRQIVLDALVEWETRRESEDPECPDEDDLVTDAVVAHLLTLTHQQPVSGGPSVGTDMRKLFEVERAKTYAENVDSLNFANTVYPCQSETKQWYGAYFFHAALTHGYREESEGVVNQVGWAWDIGGHLFFSNLQNKPRDGFPIYSTPTPREVDDATFFELVTRSDVLYKTLVTIKVDLKEALTIDDKRHFEKMIRSALWTAEKTISNLTPEVEP